MVSKETLNYSTLNPNPLNYRFLWAFIGNLVGNGKDTGNKFLGMGWEVGSWRLRV